MERNRNNSEQVPVSTYMSKPAIYLPLKQIQYESPEAKALAYTEELLNSEIPFNDYFKASDMSLLRKALTKITDKGVSNCTLNATNAYGDKYTRASARTITTGDPDYEEITGTNKIVPGVLMIQSLPGKNDSKDDIYHSAIYAGTADSSYVNRFGDIINVGDSLYRYSNGKADKGDFRERPKEALMNNHGKTRFRYYRPKRDFKKYQAGGDIVAQDNTRVSLPQIPIKFKLTPEQIKRLQQRKLLEYQQKNQTRVYDKDKADYYRNIQNFYNNNFFGYGVFGNQTRHDPSTPEGQRAIQSDFDYSKSNVQNLSENIAGVGVAGAASKAISKGSQVYSKLFKGPFKSPSKRGSLGTMKQYTKNGTLGSGSEAVVINNTPTTVGKITTIPQEEMMARNAIPNTVQSRYIGFVKDKGTKLPTYIQRKVKTLTEETFPRYVEKLDNAMAKSGFRRVTDPNVQYRAYTNGQVVIDDVAPGNVGLDWLRRPRMIDFNLQTVPEWTAQGFTLRKGGKLLS